MKIVCYTYDDTGNPWCGGGGAFRIETVHSLLSSQGHEVVFISGNYPGAKQRWTGNFKKKFYGVSWSYLLSRITFTVIANMHSIFCKADIFLTVFSVYAPVFNFLFRKRVILEFYHLLGKRTVEKYGVLGWLPFFFEKTMLASAKVIITMAPGTRQTVLNSYPNKEIHALPCGFDEKQLLLEPVNDKYILVFGRIDIYMKGIDRLIPVMTKVLERSPDYKLVIAGRGSEEDISALKRMINDSGLRNRTDILINPEYSVKLDLFRRCTYVAIFSRFEGWCIVAIEAAAAGKAVLGVDVEGLRDSVSNGFNGLLIKDFDEQDLIESGHRLIVDNTFRKSFEVNARTHASRFTWLKIAGMQESVYDQLIAKYSTQNVENKLAKR